MGAFTSKQHDPADEIVNDFADMFADAMERADWHGARKPTWQQSRDQYIVNIRGRFAA